MNIDKEKFDFVLDQIDNDYKGYNLQQIIAVELGLILIEKDVLHCKSLFKIFFHYSFNKTIINTRNFFVLGAHGRKDYREIVRYVTNQLTANTWKLLDFNSIEVSLHIRLASVFQYFNLLFKLKGLDLKKRMLLASKIIFYQNSINNLEKKFSISNKCKHVVLFSSIHPWEAMMLNFCAKRNIDSISLQHGVYFVYKETTPIDYVLYRNFNADMHLCWGEYSKNQFIDYGIEENRLVVAGYPRISKPYSSKVNEGFNSIVLLARKVLNKSNISLLTLLKDFIKKDNSYKFYLKPHPSLMTEDFHSYIDNKNIFLVEGGGNLQKVLSTGKFTNAICVYTTAYYEAYLNSVKGLRFHDGSSELSEGVSLDTFSNLEEFQVILKNQICSEEKINFKLNYIVGHQINNYTNILEG